MPMKHKLHILLNAADEKFSFCTKDFADFSARHPSIEIQIIESEEELIRLLPEVVWLDTWHFLAEWYALAPNLKGIFTPAAGKDYIATVPSNEDHEKQISIHHGTFHGTMMAESALAMILHFSTNLHSYGNQQTSRVWQRIPARLLRHQTVLILGYGHIGKQCGQMLAGLGMTVWGHQRQPKSNHDGAVTLISQAQLDDHLPLADHVVSFLPGGPVTYHFISQERLSLMAPTAYLYNFGRGTTIDETALLDALQHQKIAGAGLDVTEIEPLPETSPLWADPRVILAPHASAYYEEYRNLHVTELTELAFSLIRNESS
jgi:D-2-hydroxyacid dehydrogenase (NADP+)